MSYIERVRASSGDRPGSHRGGQVREDVSAEADKVEGWQYPKRILTTRW